MDAFDDDILDDDLREEINESNPKGDDDGGDQASDSGSLFGMVKASVHGAAIAPLVAATPLIRPLPMTWKLYHKIHTWSAWQMQRAAGADALANVRLANDKEDVLPAKYVRGQEDEREMTGWKIKGRGDKRYDTGVRGGASSRFGRADLIHINEDDPEQGTWTEAAIDTAFALNREQYLFRDATLNVQHNVIARDPSLGNGGETAVADGGTEAAAGAPGAFDIEYETESYDIDLTRPGILDDVLVPITSRGGYDGQVISWDQYSNIKQEKADQESIRDAKNAGWMAAKLDDVDGTDLLKWALIIGLWSVLLLFHQDIGAMISGLGGGDAVGDAAGGVGLGLLPLIGSRLRGE